MKTKDVIIILLIMFVLLVLTGVIRLPSNSYTGNDANDAYDAYRAEESYLAAKQRDEIESEADRVKTENLRKAYNVPKFQINLQNPKESKLIYPDDPGY